MRLTVREDFINSENILNQLLVYLSRFYVSHKINMVMRIQNGLKITGFKIRVNITFCNHSSDFDSDTPTIKDILSSAVQKLVVQINLKRG